MVSVIMPAYNSEKTITESIKSVLCQTYKFWELIIINDGSTDNTENLIKSFNDNRIIYIYQNNKGVSAARNLGLTLSTGSYIGFLDSDDIWESNKLEIQINYFKNNNEISMIHTDFMTFKDSIDHCKYKKYIEPYNNINTYFYRLLINDIIVTSSVILKKEVYDKVGLFDNSFYGVEDWDYWIRVSKNFNISYIDNCLTYYRENEAGISKNLKRQLNQEFLIRRKHLTFNVPKNVIKLSEWQYLKKELYYIYTTKNLGHTFLFYLKLIVNYPFKKDTYLLPFNLFSKIIKGE
jgi:glycosyltransferase involved in cell wall biosynthesis